MSTIIGSSWSYLGSIPIPVFLQLEFSSLLIMGSGLHKVLGSSWCFHTLMPHALGTPSPGLLIPNWLSYLGDSLKPQSPPIPSIKGIVARPWVLAIIPSVQWNSDVCWAFGSLFLLGTICFHYHLSYTKLKYSWKVVGINFTFCFHSKNHSN